MNIKLTGWIVLTFLGAVIVGVVWYVAFAPKASPQQTAQPSTTLPISGLTVPAPTQANPSRVASSQPAQTITLTTLNGSTVIANDFIHNGITLPDISNKGQYLLEGDLGYCVSDLQKCHAGAATDFSVSYNSTYGSFNIGLLREPLGQARLDAEQFMLATLGITQSQMCSLNYYVGTTFDVNAAYSTKNLGFSFCPGATALPK